MDEAKTVTLNFQIQPYNIDAAGHVNNAVYINWFEDLRTRWFDEYFSLQNLLENRIYPVVVSTEICYKKVLHLFDNPVGVMHIESCKHGVLLLKAEIKLGDKISAYGKQKCVLYDLNTSGIISFERQKLILGHIPKIMNPIK